jgi:hypothetical protein
MKKDPPHTDPHKQGSNIQNTASVNSVSNPKKDTDSVSENTENTTASQTKMIEWSKENEEIIVEWSDIAQCYKWMHTRSHNVYSTMHAGFTIPAIIFSTITGTASFAQASLPANLQLYAPMVIGTINILIGILTTIQQYLKVSEYNEAHRVSALSWDKFSRNIRIELAKPPHERMDAGHFLKLNRQEYDRLMETSPSIMRSIVRDFSTKFMGKENSIERKRFEELKKPDICNIIITSNEYRHPWYKEPVYSVPPSETNESKNEFKSLEEYEQIKNERESQKQIRSLQLRKINEYISTFQRMYGRKPLSDEILEHCKEDTNKDQREMINKFLEKYSTEDISAIV